MQIAGLASRRRQRDTAREATLAGRGVRRRSGRLLLA